MWKLILAVFISAGLNAADLDNNTVTVTASRTINVQPDQVSFYVDVITAQAVGLDDVLSALKGTGISATDLNSVYGESNETSRWSFLLLVPFSAMTARIAALNQIQAKLLQPDGSPALTFTLNGAQVSAEARAAQACPLPALVADARKQADAMAAAAAMRTGAITVISDQPLSVAGFPVTVFTPGSGQPSFVTADNNASSTSVVLDPSSVANVATVTWSLTVQFKLL